MLHIRIIGIRRLAKKLLLIKFAINSNCGESMEYVTALSIYKSISETEQKKVLNELVLSAVEYARIRTDWYLSDKERRIELNERRTAAHNTLIDS